MSDKDKPDVPTPQGPLDAYNGCVDLDTWPGYETTQEDCSNRVYGLDAVGDYTTRPYIDAQTGPGHFDLDVDGSTRIKGGLVIEGADGKDINVGEFMKTIGERLSVLQPNLEMHEHYPALKDAYDQYKMLEKLLTEGKDGKKG